MSSAINKSEAGAAVRPSLLRQLCAVRPIDPEEPGGKSRLKQVLGPGALTAIGLGATIGTGIFVLTGQVAANQTGPAITLALAIAAFGSMLAALCYSEFAAFLPVPGSAYRYTYATLGEALAWFIGWNLLLEYAISASTVAVSWSAYVMSLLNDAHIHLPDALVNAPVGVDAHDHLQWTGALINVPAILIVLAMTWLLYVGVSQSARANTF
ncbi:MAG TPA: amino acid permease, partial [Steroidobacteraceae bacterium]|nr:amino acid permease [Steroidobacteraceae bacterium]